MSEPFMPFSRFVKGENNTTWIVIVFFLNALAYPKPKKP